MASFSYDFPPLYTSAPPAAAAGLITRAWQIFTCETWFLGGQGYWADCRAAGQAVLAAAAGDHAVLGWTHAIIGRYCTLIGAHDENSVHQQQALNHFRQAGDLPG